ncbi:hypothetical protein [Yinghuangia sp. YIM S10712]|uniref:hypothetical protein n=1 Tax=Yinghuangia sp. YIM S10712 TaxID=3436930 RepID=UPI003F537702
MIEALTVLAAEADAQRQWLDEHVVGTDELALDFDHAFRLADGFLAEGRIDHEAMACLRDIDALLAEMSCCGNEECWARDALSVDAGWQRARVLSRGLLVRLRGEWRLPLPEIVVVR